MNIRKKTEEELTIFELEGGLDNSTAPLLQSELIPEFDVIKEVVLDFERLTYVSSAGLRILLMGAKAARAKGATQVLINVSKDVMEVLEMTGFSGILNIRKDSSSVLGSA